MIPLYINSLSVIIYSKSVKHNVRWSAYADVATV